MSSINASIVPWRVVPRDAERQRCPEICIPPSARGQRSDDAARQHNRHFFRVLDEINRGDLSRIFGELITTIEYDKRDRRIKLPVTGSSFAIPRNVFLIGTMNTADDQDRDCGAAKIQRIAENASRWLEVNVYSQNLQKGSG